MEPISKDYIVTRKKFDSFIYKFLNKEDQIHKYLSNTQFCSLCCVKTKEFNAIGYDFGIDNDRFIISACIIENDDSYHFVRHKEIKYTDIIEVIKLNDKYYYKCFLDALNNFISEDFLRYFITYKNYVGDIVKKFSQHKLKVFQSFERYEFLPYNSVALILNENGYSKDDYNYLRLVFLNLNENNGLYFSDEIKEEKAENNYMFENKVDNKTNKFYEVYIFPFRIEVAKFDWQYSNINNDIYSCFKHYHMTKFKQFLGDDIEKIFVKTGKKNIKLLDYVKSKNI